MRGSLAQQGMWVTERAFDVGTAYRMPLTVRLDGAVDVGRLRRAVEEVVARHPLLSMGVEDRDGVPYLVPADEPLCRFTVEPHAGGVTLSVLAHHLVFDGGSKDVLVHDLAAAYGGTLDPAPVPFVADDGVELAAAQEFWAGHEHGEVTLPGLRRGDDPAADSVPLDLSGLAPARFGVTTFELLTAAWLALLQRYGNENPVVAVDLGTRTEATRNAIGPFVNELPVQCGRYETFGSLVAATRARVREIYPFRAVPLARAVPGLAPRPAVAPTSISYRRRAGDPVFDGLHATVEWMLPSGALRSTVHLQAVEGPDGIEANLQYRTACLDRASATRLAEELRELLTEARPDLPLSPNAMAGPATTVPDGTVAELLAGRPDAVAVVAADGTRLTYAELAAWAGRIAAGLRDHGVRPGSLVGVCLRRGPAMVAAVLGVWRAGAAYVPLDPDYPAERLAYMFHDSGAILLVTERGLDPVAGAPVWHTEDAPDIVAEPAAGVLAYVIYTSGSTGRPKGVAVPHRALVNVLHAVGDVLGSTEDDRWLASTSLSFDISVLELFLPLVTGGSVVLAGDGRDTTRVAGLVRAEGVTHVQATPTGWRLLLDANWPAVTALVGGEPLPLPLARELRPRVRRLLNMYGPTETTVWSTYWEVPPSPTTVLIGQPLANTTVSVRDGELWIGGAGLAAGYHNRPEQTASRFVDGWYRTGDVVRLRDGVLEFVGRSDTQVKVRGHRVELGEVEARLAEHPGVRSAVVLSQGDDLVGYVEGDAEPDELRGFLARTLPNHMVPGQFVAVDEWPTTPNGKLDRAALPAPVITPSSVDGGVLGQLGDIWREVLRVETVGPDDDLFDLGGHSLTITQIAARVRDRLGVDVPLDVFYDAPTLAEITAVVVKLRGTEE